jgi:dipeptidyl aminopeptidase/acylaminoacyl peptidase
MVALTNDFSDNGYPDVSSKVKVLVDMYGNVDLSSHRDYKNIFGYTRAENADIYKRYSPFNYIHTNAPPTLIIHSN